MNMVAIGRVVLTRREHVIALEARGRGLVFRVSRFGILRGKLLSLKLKPGQPSEKHAPSAVTPAKAEGKHVDEKGKEGKASEVSSKGAGTRQR